MRKTFKIDYRPLNPLGLEYHIELSEDMSDKEQSTFSFIPGVSAVRISDRAMDVRSDQVLSPYDMIASFEVFMVQMGYKNVGIGAKELLDIKRSFQNDPMNSTVKEICDMFERKNPKQDNREQREKSLLVLKKDLRFHVDHEEYEAAAVVRDRIAEIEKEVELRLNPKKK